MMASAVHLMANAAHPSVAPEVHPSVIPDVRRWPLQYFCWQMQYTQVRLLMYMMDSVVHLMVNVVHSSEAPELHDGICICSALVGNCITPK